MANEDTSGLSPTKVTHYTDSSILPPCDFGFPHNMLRPIPAAEAGVTGTIWDIDDTARLAEKRLRGRSSRKPTERL